VKYSHTKYLFLRLIKDFDIFYKVNSAPAVCACFYFHTPFGCPPCSSRKNQCVHCLRSSTFWSLSSLSGLSVYWNNIFMKIQTTFFFPHCTIEASACRITLAKTKDKRIGTSPGWKNRRYCEQRIQFCSTLTLQFSCLKFAFSSFQLHWK